MKTLMNRWTVLFAAVAVLLTIGFMTQTDQAKEPDKVYVNGKLMETVDFEHVNYNSQFKTVYVPMKAVAEAVGMSVTKPDMYSLEITDKTGMNYLMYVGASTVTSGPDYSKSDVYASKIVNGVKVPVQKGPYLSNDVFMVPHETFSEVFDMEVTATKRSDGGYDVLIGSQVIEEPPAEEEPPVEEPEPGAGDVAENPLYPFPEGWTAKSIGDNRVTGDVKKDLQTVGTMLGFHPEDIRDSVAYFDPDNQLNYTLMFGRESFEEFEVKMTIVDLTYDKNGSYMNKTAYVLAEVLKFYEVPSVYNIIEAGMIRKDFSGYEKKTVVNGREVEMWTNGGKTILYIGKKGKTYDESWNLKK